MVGGIIRPVKSQLTNRQFLRKAAIVAICGGVLFAAFTAAIEAYEAAYDPRSGHGDWSTLLQMMIRIPAFYFLTALRLDHAFTPSTRFGDSALVVIANGVCVVTLVMAYAVFLVLCRWALESDKNDKGAA